MSPFGKRGGKPSEKFEPDREQLGKFIRALFRHADAGCWISFAAFFDGSNEVFRLSPVQIGEDLEPVIEAAHRAAGAVANLPRPATFAPPVCSFDNATRRRDQDVANGLALSVEIDGGDAFDAVVRLIAVIGPPTIVMESGTVRINPETGGTLPNLHAHWRLAEPTRTAEEHKRLRAAREIATRFIKSDGTAKPISHPLRWAGSWNKKVAGQERIAKLVLCDENEIDLEEAYHALADVAGAEELAKNSPGDRTAPEALIADAMAAIPNPDVHYDEWIRMGYAVWRATNGGGFTIFRAWSRKSDKHDEAQTEKTWAAIGKSVEGGSHEKPNGAGTIFHFALENGWRWPDGETEPEGDLAIWDAGEDDYAIPPREWLLGNVFCKGFLSSLLADGATGKTALRIAQVLSLATKRGLTGEFVFRRCRCLLVCFEDTKDELRRRVYAAMLKYEIGPADLKGWLFLSAPKGVKLARMRKDAPEAGALVTLLRAAITQHNIDLVVLDPFIKTHSVNENDNNAVDFVCDLLAAICLDLNVAIDTPHHTRKGAAAPGDADRGRGASAAKDAARLAYTMTRMTPDEAAWFNVGEVERRSFVRIDSAKVNLLPPAAADTKWFRLVGQGLGNATQAYPGGDEIQTVEPWKPPGVWHGLDDGLLMRILGDIDAGRPDGQRYTDANAAGACAAWHVVRTHVPAKQEKNCRAIIKDLIKAGALFSKKYHNPVRRREAEGLFADTSRRPVFQS